jgi:hypothetical protein
VGRYGTLEAADKWKEVLSGDLKAATANHQMYMPLVFPGFSWNNLKRNNRPNQIPRSNGEFLCRQAYNAKRAGAKMLKIAMFDELDEGTAILKVASHRQDAPEQGFWLTLDADGAELPSDWYLRLAGGDHAHVPRRLSARSKVAHESRAEALKPRAPARRLTVTPWRASSCSRRCRARKCGEASCFLGGARCATPERRPPSALDLGGRYPVRAPYLEPQCRRKVRIASACESILLKRFAERQPVGNQAGEGLRLPSSMHCF